MPAKSSDVVCASSVSYYPNDDVISLDVSGVTYSLSPGRVAPFAIMTPDVLSSVSLNSRGAAVSVAGITIEVRHILATVVPPSVAFCVVGRLNGAKSSARKTATARANGKKGGRPPKKMGQAAAE